MLWITGSLFLIVWFVLRFLFHKTGAVHTLLLTAIAFYAVQFAQDWRTREYRKHQAPDGSD